MVKGLLVEVVYNQHLKYKGYVEDVDDKCIYIRDLYDSCIKSHILKFVKIYNINTKNTIYIITNKVNQKQYIGRTIDNIEKRLRQHYTESKHCYSQTPLHIDMQKYGIENFTIEKLYEFSADTQKIANITEQCYIEKFNTKIPNGYNIL